MPAPAISLGDRILVVELAGTGLIELRVNDGWIEQRPLGAITWQQVIAVAEIIIPPPDLNLLLREVPANEVLAVLVTSTNPDFIQRIFTALDGDHYEHGIRSSPFWDGKLDWEDDGFGLGHWRFTDDLTATQWVSDSLSYPTPPSSAGSWTQDAGTTDDGVITAAVYPLTVGQSLRVLEDASANPGIFTLVDPVAMIWHPPGTLWNADSVSYQRPVLSGETLGSQSLVYVNL
ncbi:MAG: hypothetical protein ABIS50_11590 [Luteolibacter sp.]|uniref:hypothetical protein n=1 Tax=Luteolibacter sp. TaxID=1962973 RepID=UPI0032679623